METRQSNYDTLSKCIGYVLLVSGVVGTYCGLNILDDPSIEMTGEQIVHTGILTAICAGGGLMGIILPRISKKTR